jgi:hypothetical protein
MPTRFLSEEFLPDRGAVVRRIDVTPTGGPISESSVAIP